MIIFDNLNENLFDFDGVTHLKDSKNLPLTIKRMLVTGLGSYGISGIKILGDDLIRAYDLAFKIYNAEDKTELDDDQVKFITKVLEATPMYMAIASGQLFKYIERARLKAISTN